MFSAMHFITYSEQLSESEQKALTEELQAAADSISGTNLMGVPLEGSANSGSMILKIGFESQDAYNSVKKQNEWEKLQTILSDGTRVSNVEFGAYDAGVYGIDNKDATDCIHRVLMFADCATAKPQDIAMLDKLFTKFHEYAPFLNWHVASVIESSGSKQWAHIWEQDFESVEIFMGQYMFTPFHPTYLDTYFDTECPNWTADPHLCSMICNESKAFLANLA